MGDAYLITGGTGSLGQALVRRLLSKRGVAKVIVLSRNEHLQVEMRRAHEQNGEKRLRFFLGDVRDRDRLLRACRGVDYVFHCAALKHVDCIEYNPDEAVEVNVTGTRNVRDAAIRCGVKKAILISSDKACNATNLYGATKFCAEKIFSTAISYAGAGGCRFASIRFGNFLGSSGSVLPLFKRLRDEGAAYLPITDARMTRFFISFDDAVDRAFEALNLMSGGEVFCPKMPSMRITDIARAVSPECELKEIGIRPGEKLDEEMIADHEAPRVREWKRFYVIDGKTGKRVPDGFIYRSDKNGQWIDPVSLEGL